ncbi:MAG: DUF2167 domain-containing protein [Myxococcota bacterium]
MPKSQPPSLADAPRRARTPPPDRIARTRPCPEPIPTIRLPQHDPTSVTQTKTSFKKTKTSFKKTKTSFTKKGNEMNLERTIATTLCSIALVSMPAIASSETRGVDAEPAAAVPASAAVPGPASAAEVAADDGLDEATRAEYERLVALDASFAYQTGTVDLADGLATLTLPSSLRYLDPEHTERLLVEGWGNPDGAGTLGMIVSADASPLSGDSWGVVISFDEDGWVSDDDADAIDYDALLAEMQAGTEQENEARAAQGYERVELVGWAEHPRYEKESHKLFWAKELAFEGSPANTLNYNVRVLGRRGVLVLNAVASMEQLELIRTVMPEVIAASEFDPGHRYADYQPGTDKVAAYGLAALVAGGVAAKSGLLTKLFALVLAGKKIVVPAVVGAVVAARAWLRRSTGGTA